jgi:hypothetical protein
MYNTKGASTDGERRELKIVNILIIKIYIKLYLIII